MGNEDLAIVFNHNDLTRAIIVKGEEYETIKHAICIAIDKWFSWKVNVQASFDCSNPEDVEAEADIKTIRIYKLLAVE